MATLPGAWFYSTSAAAASPVAKAVEAAEGGARITVLTLNLAKVTAIDQIARELAPADVYLFQEVVRTDEASPSVAEKLAARLGYNVQFVSPDSGQTLSGIAIVSRFPLSEVKIYQIKPINLVFRSRKRVLLGATAETPAGKIRLVCAHLDTRINPADRLRELEPAISDTRNFPGPVLIGGDLNTNDMQWVSHVVPVPWPGWQGGRVRALMAQNGFHTPFVNGRATHDSLGMQLDWIFLRNLAATKSDILPVEFSDHHAVVTVLGLPRP